MSEELRPLFYIVFFFLSFNVLDNGWYDDGCVQHHQSVIFK